MKFCCFKWSVCWYSLLNSTQPPNCLYFGSVAYFFIKDCTYILLPQPLTACMQVWARTYTWWIHVCCCYTFNKTTYTTCWWSQELYHPVSSLTFLSQLVERVIAKMLLEHIYDHNLDNCTNQHTKRTFNWNGSVLHKEWGTFVFG